MKKQNVGRRSTFIDIAFFVLCSIAIKVLTDAIRMSADRIRLSTDTLIVSADSLILFVTT